MLYIMFSGACPILFARPEAKSVRVYKRGTKLRDDALVLRCMECRCAVPADLLKYDAMREFVFAHVADDIVCVQTLTKDDCRFEHQELIPEDHFIAPDVMVVYL